MSAKRIATINGARLDDVAGVRTLRAAATAPHLWAYVHPAVEAALFHLTVKADVIGMARDELLAEIEDYLDHAAKMRTAVMPVLEFIELQLDLSLEQHRDAKTAETAVKAARRQHSRRGGAVQAAKKRRRRDTVAAAFAARRRQAPDSSNAQIARWYLVHKAPMTQRRAYTAGSDEQKARIVKSLVRRVQRAAPKNP